MKKYPLRLSVGVLVITCLFVMVYPSLLGSVMAFGLISALVILRQSEALYLVVLLTFMFVFLDMMVVIGLGGVSMIELIIPIVLQVIQLSVLVKLSYICFGAIQGGGNYKIK